MLLVQALAREGDPAAVSALQAARRLITALQMGLVPAIDQAAANRDDENANSADSTR